MKSRTFLAVFLLLMVLALLRVGERARENTTGEKAVLVGDGYALRVEIADSAAERVRGLGGREKLGANEGMLFIFPRAEHHGIWMKDMAFPIDILWLADADVRRYGETQIIADRGIGVNQRGNQRPSAFRVVDVRENISPETFPKVFYPKEKARYVLEVKSGFAKERGVAVGDGLAIEQEKTRR